MPKIHVDAQKLIDDWTNGLNIITTIQPFPDMVMTVAKDEDEKYHVTRYFTIAGIWKVSADAQGVNAEEAFKELGKQLTQ